MLKSPTWLRLDKLMINHVSLRAVPSGYNCASMEVIQATGKPHVRGNGKKVNNNYMLIKSRCVSAAGRNSASYTCVIYDMHNNFIGHVQYSVPYEHACYDVITLSV